MQNTDTILASLNKLSEDKKSIGLALFDEFIYIKELLDKLKDDINSKGIVEQFINGKQQFTIESKSLNSYNKLVKTYNNLCKDLINILPKDNANGTFDDFDNDDLDDFDIDKL